MVSKIEKDFLMKEKECEGKERTQAIKEIKNLEKSQVDFKTLKKENRRLLNENEILKSKLKENKNNIFKELRKSPVEVKGSLVHINRIINQMEKNVPYTITELKDFLLMNSNELRECIIIINKCKNVNIEIKDDKFIRTQ